MSVVFSVLVYLVAGIAAVVWLAGQRRLPSGIAVRIGALIFWPAYLPLLSSARRESGPTAGLLEQIERMPIDGARKEEYRRAVDRLGAALDSRAQELARLEQARVRLGELEGSFGVALVEKERARVEGAHARVARDLARAREGIVRLALRLELVDLDGARGELDVELAALEEELERLVNAREVAESVA